MRLEAKSVSPIKHERLYFLKPKRTESEKSEIYDRHARATPVKERYLSAEVLAEIKVLKMCAFWGLKILCKFKQKREGGLELN